MAVAGTLEIDVVLNGKKVRVGLNDLRKRMGLLEKSANKTNKVFGKLAKFATIGYLAKMTLDASKLNRELGIMSNMTGVSVESLSKMRNAFKYAGGDAKTLDRVVSNITQRLARARVFGDQEGFARGLQLMGIKDLNQDPMKMLAGIADYSKSRVKEREQYYINERGFSIEQAKAMARSEVFSFVNQIVPEIDFLLFEELLKGGNEWLAGVQNAAGISNEASKNLDEAGKRLNKATTNFTNATQETLGSLAEVEKEIGLLEKSAEFAKENPKTATTVGIASTLFGAKGISMLWNSLGGLIKSPTAWAALGVGLLWKENFEMLYGLLQGKSLPEITENKSWLSPAKQLEFLIGHIYDFTRDHINKSMLLYYGLDEDKIKKIREEKNKMGRFSPENVKHYVARIEAGELKTDDGWMTLDEVLSEGIKAGIPEGEMLKRMGKSKVWNPDTQSWEWDSGAVSLFFDSGISGNGFEQPQLPPPGYNYGESNPDVTVINNTEITPMPDGKTFENDTTTIVETGSSSFTQNQYQVITGGGN